MLTPVYISEVLAALAASVYFYKYKKTAIWLILPILWLAVFAETAGHLYSSYVYPNNSWIYNSYSLIYYGLFYIMIYGYVKNTKRRTIIKLLSAVLLLIFFINCFIANPTLKPLTYFKIGGTIILIINLMLASIEVLKSNKILKFKNSLPFFIFVGYLIIAIALVPINIIRNVDIFNWDDSIYYGVNTLLAIIIILANSIFIFGFIWTQPIPNSQLS